MSFLSIKIFALQCLVGRICVWNETLIKMGNTVLFGHASSLGILLSIFKLPL
jgi:hypothetical protein